MAPTADWARILSMVLFGLATLQTLHLPAATQPLNHAGFGATVLYYGGTALLWRPGWPTLLRCGCCGVRPPAGSSSRRASRTHCRVICEPR